MSKQVRKLASFCSCDAAVPQVYGRVRHPGYLGFALWAVGTQLLLANPLCCCMFIAVVGFVWMPAQPNNGAFCCVLHVRAVCCRRLSRTPRSLDLLDMLQVWVFFSRRIPIEEQQLMRFFGEAYTAYQQRVPCGIPLIS